MQEYPDQFQNSNSSGKGFISFIRRKWKLLFFLGGVVPAFLFLVFIITAYIQWRGVKPSADEIIDSMDRELSGNLSERDKTPISIYDRNGILIGELRRTSLPEIRPENMQNYSGIVWALLASEDREFYSHGGVRLKAIVRALYQTVLGRSVQGGSTITQQLAKLILSDAEGGDRGDSGVKIRSRNVFNKVSELFCTWYLERKFDKNTILAMYLNRVFLGFNSVGFDDAARKYFGVSASQLSLGEAALLVGIIPAPSSYNPTVSVKRAQNRQKLILQLMEANPDLSPTPQKLNVNLEVKRLIARHDIQMKEVEGGKIYRSRIGKYPYARNIEKNLAPDFNNEIENWLRNQFPSEEIKSSVLRIDTSLDLRKQKIAANLIEKRVKTIRDNFEKEAKELKGKNNTQEEKDLLKLIAAGTNGSMISINPENGYIETMVGSYLYSSASPLNRALHIYRQPGSTIKSLVYSLALEEKIINPLSVVEDKAVSAGGYSPRNWYSGYRGKMLTRNAFALSVNTIPVMLLKEVGVRKMVNTMQAMLGMTDEEIDKRIDGRANLSMALGSIEVSPFELARIYASLASGGYRVDPVMVTRVKSFDNQDLFVYEPPEEKTPVIDPIAAAMTLNLMQGVISEGGTMVVKNKKLQELAGGKTGTVQSPASAKKRWHRTGVRDTWFAGVLPNEVTVIWIGNEQGAPIPGSGGGNTGSVWQEYSENLVASGRLDKNKFLPPLPDSAYKTAICADSGMLLNPELECEHPLYNQVFYPELQPRFEQRTEEYLAMMRKAAEELVPREGESEINPFGESGPPVIGAASKKLDMSNAGGVELEDSGSIAASAPQEWQFEEE
ncbi:MAG: penicillin-binding protein [Leptospiraceae bacterium]|nr:penicillin-binding protein [Leptospiraceae bacterium]